LEDVAHLTNGAPYGVVISDTDEDLVEANLGR
jgi:hypothetical protein